ncbi:MAG: hypothetical protein J3K34DRAFT_441306 [Monoraphidium minutum]|nr:MAG: hypothetical protein J3K34DRAFT_441306 [Monoraphidium minutum]
MLAGGGGGGAELAGPPLHARASIRARGLPTCAGAAGGGSWRGVHALVSRCCAASFAKARGRVRASSLDQTRRRGARAHSAVCESVCIERRGVGTPACAVWCYCERATAGGALRKRVGTGTKDANRLGGPGARARPLPAAGHCLAESAGGGKGGGGACGAPRTRLVSKVELHRGVRYVAQRAHTVGPTPE